MELVEDITDPLSVTTSQKTSTVKLPLLTVIENNAEKHIFDLIDMQNLYDLVRTLNILSEVCEWGRTWNGITDDRSKYVTEDKQKLKFYFEAFVHQNCVKDNICFKGWDNGSMIKPIFEVGEADIVCNFEECSKYISDGEETIIGKDPHIVKVANREGIVSEKSSI